MKPKHILICLLLFATSFLIYKSIYPSPRNWYDHYRHLAQSFLAGRVDTPNLPQFYHDTIKINGRTFLPFPPGPALILIPFILINSNITQQQVSIIIGSLNVALVFLLLSRFTREKYAFLLALFFGFGTVAFWAAVVGTTWYFGHTTALLFFFSSLLLTFNKKYFLSGILFALAAVCRYPMLLTFPFFLLHLWRAKKNLVVFATGSLVFVPVQLIYNYLRFGNLWETGYYLVYKNYVDSGIAYSILNIWQPALKLAYFDIRSIPLHLYTFLVMPPNISLHPFKITPSPFGMGILFTSPLLLKTFFPLPKTRLGKTLWAGILPVAFLVFTHYAQGWVQFGYRFLLDFLPFLLILLARRFKPRFFPVLLLVISILVNFWGVKEGIALGW